MRHLLHTKTLQIPAGNSMECRLHSSVQGVRFIEAIEPIDSSCCGETPVKRELHGSGGAMGICVPRGETRSGYYYLAE